CGGRARREQGRVGRGRRREAARGAGPDRRPDGRSGRVARRTAARHKGGPATRRRPARGDESKGETVSEAQIAGGARRAAGLAKAIVEIRGLRKAYHRDRQELVVLDGIDLDIPEGSFEALMGPSGSGKTTLLNLIAGIDQQTAG